MKKITIIGASGHGRVVADIARLNGYDDISFLDDNSELKNCGRYKVVGSSQVISDIDSDFVVGIGNADIRNQILSKLEQLNKSIVSLIHPNAVVGEDVSIDVGTVVMAGAVINPGTRIGKGVIINTCSSVDHDCVIEDYVHVAVGAHICGTVTVGKSTWVGAGSTISNNINVCSYCMIGAGAVVISDIFEPGTYLGLPAKKVAVK